MRYALLLALLASHAVAELQNVAVNGEIRVRGRYWSNVYANAVGGPAVARFPATFVLGRPLGPFGTSSRFDFDDRRHNLSLVEMRTRLGANAQFSRDVNAVIELESYELWGEDFRSTYVNGLDLRSTTTNDVEVYQSYIDAREIASAPLRLRIGRQEMKFGKGWLVDDITTAIVGRSFDAARVTYSDGPWELDAWWSKLAENSPAEEDGDIDFYGVYGTYRCTTALQVSAYWMLVRDAVARNDTARGLVGEAIEDLLGLDDYDPGYLHTIGLRVFGSQGPWDYDLELAYQLGTVDPAGASFAPYVYGDDDASYDSVGADIEVGRALDVSWKPRVFVGGAYFSGEDQRELNALEWLAAGFHQPESSVSFNRLFAGKPYSLILEINQELSNFWQIRGGLSAQPTEKISVGARLAYFGVDEPFERPRLPYLSFITKESSSEIGYTSFLWLKYAYSADVAVTLGWEHLFTGEGLEEGNYIARNGLQLVRGSDGDDADYVHFDLGIKF